MNLNLDKLKHKSSGQFFLFAGPCVIEGEDMAMEIAEKCVEITNKLKIPYVFKGSFKNYFHRCIVPWYNCSTSHRIDSDFLQHCWRTFNSFTYRNKPSHRSWCCS